MYTSEQYLNLMFNIGSSDYPHVVSHWIPHLCHRMGNFSPVNSAILFHSCVINKQPVFNVFSSVRSTGSQVTLFAYWYCVAAGPLVLICMLPTARDLIASTQGTLRPYGHRILCI